MYFKGFRKALRIMNKTLCLGQNYHFYEHTVEIKYQVRNLMKKKKKSHQKKLVFDSFFFIRISMQLLSLLNRRHKT